MENTSDKFFADNKCIIYKGKFWNVLLHQENQSYLGRSIVYLKSRRLEDVLGLTKEERDELWDEVLPKLANALQRAFQVDRINYAHLANTVHHVHWHVVPRYEKNPERTFAGEMFKDENVGKHYAPAEPKKLSRDILEKIYREIKNNFEF